MFVCLCEERRKTRGLCVRCGNVFPSIIQQRGEQVLMCTVWMGQNIVGSGGVGGGIIEGIKVKKRRKKVVERRHVEWRERIN